MIGRFLAVGLLLTLNGHAQTPAQASDKPSIRVTTRMVQVNVVVHRGSGPSTGLTKEDFQIFDKGKEQRIAAFSGGAPRASASTTGSISTVASAGPAPPSWPGNFPEKNRSRLSTGFCTQYIA